MNAVWEDQWLSLSCQWELVVWMCMCFVVSYIISTFCSSFNILDFFLKSSDLSMVNPHTSLNLQNPPIHGAILRFSKDFYCEIHGFCWQSSDLAMDLSKSSGGSEEFISFCLGVSVTFRQWLPFTISSVCPTVQLRCNVFLRAGLSEHRSRSEHRLQICLCWVNFSFIFCSIHSPHHEILKFGVKSLDS